MIQLNTDPFFSSLAQETRTVGERVYAVARTILVKEGAEGVFAGRHESMGLIVDWDTPSGTPCREGSIDEAAIRSLYR